MGSCTGRSSNIANHALAPAAPELPNPYQKVVEKHHYQHMTVTLSTIIFALFFTVGKLSHLSIYSMNSHYLKGRATHLKQKYLYWIGHSVYISIFCLLPYPFDSLPLLFTKSILRHCTQNQCWAWALEMSLRRPAFFQYFWQFRKYGNFWRVNNRQNHCPYPKPSFLVSPGLMAPDPTPSAPE